MKCPRCGYDSRRKGTEERAFTTFEVAKMLQVWHTTVINWTKEGKLKCYETPGGHRRITASHLREFLRRNSMPTPMGFSLEEPDKLQTAIAGKEAEGKQG